MLVYFRSRMSPDIAKGCSVGNIYFCCKNAWIIEERSFPCFSFLRITLI